MLHTNPIFLRFCRSELRLRKAIFWYLLVLIVTAFTVSIIYAPMVVRGGEPETAARSALLPLMIIQGIILLFMGTGNVASGITREKVDDVLNYQRLTPLPIGRKITGYLFGLPVRQYVLFSITLPFLLFIIVVGNLPLLPLITYYAVFFSSTLLYHQTGMVAGMLSRRWRWSARIAQGMIILLYFVLPQMSHLGLVFFEFLTVRPVFSEQILPLVAALPNVQMEGIGFMSGKSVPFYKLEISGTLFSFIIQSGLVTLFTLVIARKWRADTMPAISKPMAIGVFAVFAVLALGNIWPNLTAASNALPIFQSNSADGKLIAVTALPLMLTLTSCALACVLLSSALPDPMQARHGHIRALRFGRQRLGSWEDAAGGYPLMAVFLGIQGLLIGISLATLYQSGFFEGIEARPIYGGALFLASALCLLYFQGLKENFGAGQLGVFGLLHGSVPILAAILILASKSDAHGIALNIAALSPLTAIPFCAAFMVPQDTLADSLASVYRSIGIALLVLAVANGYLHYRRLRTKQNPEPRDSGS